MTRQDAYRAEQKEMEAHLGYSIRLSEVPDIMKTVAKIVQVINNSDFGVTYKEARLVLRLADKSLREISGGID